MTTITAASIAERNVRSALSAVGFVQVGPEAFYPTGPSISLVKVEVFGGQLQLWRRPKARDQWTRISVFDCEDVEPSRLNKWCHDWPLIEHS